MVETTTHTELLVVTIGGIVILALLIKAVFSRLHLPSLIGYILIGFLFGIADRKWGFMTGAAQSVFDLFSKLGVIALLFGVGLKSHFRKLLGYFRSASFVWIGNIIVSGLAGFFAGRLLGFDLIPSLIIGVAMTATSVGVSANVWEDAGAIESDDGQRFVDVAEMDDISGIVFMVILFSLLPQLQKNAGAENISAPLAASGAVWTVVKTTGLALGKLALFSMICFFFARYAEKPLIRFFSKNEPPTDAVISIISLGIIIAGVAGLMGFSVAIGAFFAGLALSKNRDVVEDRTPFITVRDLFVPFFFVSIGFGVDIGSLENVWLPALALLVLAFAGKFIGTTVPALRFSGWGRASVLGLSMVPRAEITMIIMAHGRQMGNWAVTPALYSAMVLVVLASCILTPPLLKALILRYSKK